MTDFPDLSRLKSNRDYQELIFHVRGLGEAYETVIDLLLQLEAAQDESSIEGDDVMGRLEVEIRTHMKYHLDQARPIVKKIASKTVHHDRGLEQ